MANYHNSTFKIRADAKPLQRSTKPMKRTQMKRGNAIRLGAGKKTRANKKTNAARKRKFEAQDLKTCELGYPGCTKDNFLSWAHGKKRRKLQGDELATCAILACINCHDVIERMSPEGMLAIVRSVIAERGWS